MPGLIELLHRETLSRCFITLENGGLLHHQGNGLYRMHPALSGFLTDRHPADEAQQRAFVEFMARFADQLAPKELHEQRGPFAVFGASFHQALALAIDLRMDLSVGALSQSLVFFAQNNRDFATATQLFTSLAEHQAKGNNQEELAGAYHQLGRIAQEQREFARAGERFLKAIIGFTKGNDRHSLGIAVSSYARNLRAADGLIQADLRRRWQDAGLDKLIPLDELEKRLND